MNALVHRDYATGSPIQIRICGNGGLNFGLIDLNFGLNFGLNETQQQVITLIAENPNINIQEIANKMNLTKRNIEYNIKTLKEKGIIERIGARKSGHWKIIKHNNRIK